MKVLVTSRGTSLIPASMIPPKYYDKVKNFVGGMIIIYNYHCEAVNGVQRDIQDQDLIPDGVYDLPDKDWQPDGSELEKQVREADAAVFIEGERR